MKLFSPRYVGMLLLLVIVAFATIYPLGMILYGSFRSAAPGEPGYFTFNGYIEGFSDPTIVKCLINTFSLGATRTFISMVLAIFFCWIIVRTDTPLKGMLEILIWINFFIPSLPIAMAWILLLDPSYGVFNQWLMKLPFIDGPVFDIYSFWGIVWVRIAFSTSVRVLMFAPAFRNMDAALEESARMSGASNLTTLIRITFPALMPAILGTTLLGFIKSLESFEVELLLGMPAKFFVFSTKVYDMLRWEPPQYPPAMALSAVFMAVIIGLVFLNRFVVQRRQYTTVTGKGYRTSPIRLGKWRYVTLAYVIVYACVFLILPLAILVVGTFMKVSGMFELPDPYTLTHWQAVLTDPLFIRSIINSLIVCGSAALGGMLFFSFLSYINIRTKLPGRGALDFMSWLPWAVPGLLLAVGLLWVFLGGIPGMVALYGTLYILIIALIINQMPMGVRVMDGTMVQISKELEESARMSGASWLYTFRRIMMPLLIPTYVSTAVIIFLGSIRDIAIVVLLYTPKSKVLSILMLEHYIGMSPEKGMVVGLIITAMCILVAIIARAVGVTLRPSS
ncbi:MAG: iron ABC transporter permease [Deltaproteobacteria bacterium]|nr:MAG: iron ABC transporter permease [Deltaproteobacteria bacterium]